jgi:hypothetical protein
LARFQTADRVIFDGKADRPGAEAVADIVVPDLSHACVPFGVTHAPN